MVKVVTVAQENNMAKKKVKQEELEVVETKTVKQRRPRVQKTTADETINVPIVDPVIEELQGILNAPNEELVDQTVTEENPWISIVSTAESLYITLEDEYKKQASNDISSMLILMSSVIKSAKKRI